MTTTTPHAQTAQVAVSARNLSKTYGMGEATVHALNNVSVDFEQGKFTAIMGPSGSGKSTLLKMISGVMRADEGEVLTRGNIAGLIEVGAGFHPDLTGRDNVYLNGRDLGYVQGGD